MSVKIKSVKLMSVNNKVRKNIGPDFSGISDFRSVDNCLKMTAYVVICGNESKNSYLRYLK